MIDPEARFQQLFDRLKASGHRMTPQRITLLRLLAASDGHPSAADLYQKIHAQFETTSLATVYKTLETLRELGEVLELRFENDNRYDGRNPHPHPHLICVRCQRISDPEVHLAEDLVTEAANRAGYLLVGHRLDIYGICPACQRSLPETS